MFSVSLKISVDSIASQLPLQIMRQEVQDQGVTEDQEVEASMGCKQWL